MSNHGKKIREKERKLCKIKSWKERKREKENYVKLWKERRKKEKEYYVKS